MRPRIRCHVLLSLVLLSPAAASAQDANIMLSPDSAERLLREANFQVNAMRDTRFEGDRTQQASLVFGGETPMLVKWAVAPRGGERFNNQPRYELAAYELQKLFLEPAEWVVPPTAIRAVPIELQRQYDRDARPTFGDTRSAVVLLQYWLWNVTGDDFWDRDRFEADTLYARHFANFNLLTYLIRHSDANEGNYLISQDSSNPRVFSVDNGVSFRSEESDRGYRWRRLQIDRLPRRTVERLRAITRERLERTLGVLVEFEVTPDGRLIPIDPGPNLDPGDGVREEDGRVQFGLTENEIRDVVRRLEGLLENVDNGGIRTF